MIKRLIVIFLILIFTFMLASCAGSLFSNKENIVENTPSINEEYPIPYDISIGYWDIDSMVGQSDEVLSFIEDKLNINITPISVSWSNYVEKYLIWASTGNLPDVFSANSTQSGTYWTWAKQGIIRNLPKDLKKYPKVEESLNYPDTSFLSIDGYHYALPRTAFIDEDLSFSDSALLVRKDWMETLGIDNPSNFEEFTQMLSRFALEDPDGNGLDDTAGLSVNNRYALGKWVILTLHADCNTYSWVKRDGMYVPSYMTDDFLDIVEAFDYMYETKALDNDFAIQQTDEATIKFASGKLGALEYKGAPSSISYIANIWKEQQPDKDFSDSVYILPVFPAIDGEMYRNKSMNYWSESLFSATVDDGKMERILSLYEYLLSDDGVRLSKFGIKDKDYKEVDDDIVILRPTIENSIKYQSINEIYPSTVLFSTLASWGTSIWDYKINGINIATYGEDAMQMSYDSMVWTMENTIEMVRPIEFMTLAEMGSNDFTSKRVIDDMTRVILSEQEPRQAWLAVMERYKEDGIDQMIQEMNILAKKYGLK